MNILVTGGAGFIASHITDAFIQLGHEVIVLDNLSTGVRANVNPKAIFVEGDITDTALVNALFAEYRFDVVNHHAAQLDIRKSVADPTFDAKTNVIGSVNLMEAAYRQGGVRLFMFASSGGAVYGEQEYFPADEKHPTAPISPYGIAKRSAELYLHYYNVVHGMNYVSFRYTNVYGPRQSAHGEAGVVAIFIDRLMEGKECIINGDGKQTRDYVYVGDLVRAHVLALQKLKGTDIFNICVEKETDVNEIFATLSQHVTQGTALAQHGPAKAGEQQRSFCSYKHIEDVLGWKPEVSLEKGLELTVESFRKA